MIKITIIVIISTRVQGKAYAEYEAGKNGSHGLVARWLAVKVKDMELFSLSSYMNFRPADT